MQVTQAEELNVRKVGVEEDLIKFRPSPNFKNMKKFLKSRSDYSETTTLANLKAYVSPVAECKTAVSDERKEIKPVVLPPHVVAAPPKVTVVQPPLPPYPPPDSPPLNVTIKQEKVDEDEVQNNSGEGETCQDNQPAVTEGQTPVEQNPGRPKKTICKEFIRGNCKRPVCRYAHEVDVSQLAGVFTFCWNYQNDVCTFPNCRFVHASVFEEAEFYRTGVLPPHARSHLKKQQAPPPPPPEETQPPPQPEIRPASFANPPPLHLTGIEQRPETEDFRSVLPRTISPLKREWSEIDDFNTSPRELEPKEHMAKKCKKCEIMEFSIKYNKKMIENLMQSSDEINEKIVLLNKKNIKLYSVLVPLLKQAGANKSPVSNGLMNGSESEKLLLLEQLKAFAGSNNNRLSSIMNEDGLKNLVGGNVTLPSLVAKLLCSAGEPTLPNDSSRET